MTDTELFTIIQPTTATSRHPHENKRRRERRRKTTQSQPTSKWATGQNITKPIDIGYEINILEESGRGGLT